MALRLGKVLGVLLQLARPQSIDLGAFFGA
jgi:hypothetical protein